MRIRKMYGRYVFVRRRLIPAAKIIKTAVVIGMGIIGLTGKIKNVKIK